jgi:hypothetical protein
MVPIDKDLEKMAKVLATSTAGNDADVTSFYRIAAILLKLQSEYVDIALLATDGHYDQATWTHKNVLDFLTKGV